VDLNIHSPISLHGIVINEIRIGTDFPGVKRPRPDMGWSAIE
jgi:hypothetical protein